jgi:glycosyltransferase involved in cell wall biosynthesis
MKNKSISVIMPSYLEEYSYEINGKLYHSATNREDKFIRAVESFLSNSYEEKELIIIADGCDKTMDLYYKHFKDYNQIKFEYVSKKPDFSGQIRNEGINMANGDIITYLDTDDYYLDNHILNIVSQFDIHQYDWVYWNDIVRLKKGDQYNYSLRDIEPKFCKIGTSCIAHNRTIGMIWQDGYNHDWMTIKKFLLPLKNKKINNCGYIVCHSHKDNNDN